MRNHCAHISTTIPHSGASVPRWFFTRDKKPVSTDPNPSNNSTEVVGKSTHIDAIVQRGTLRLGVEPEAPPMNYMENGLRKGFDVEMAEEIATNSALTASKS